MLRAALLLCFASALVSPAAGQGEDAAGRRGTIGKALVAAPRLRVRKAPSVSAAPLGAVTEGKPLALLAKSTFTETIDGRPAPWYRVRTLAGTHLEGWAFGGYMDLAPEPENGVDPWLAALCYADIRTFGESPESAAAKLGPPLSSQLNEEPSLHEEGRTNKMRTLKFAGASLRFNETPYKTFLEGSVLTADVPGLNDLLKIGSAPRDIRGILGDPQRDDIKTMTYACNLEQNDSIVLSFHLDRLTAVEWRHFTD